MRFVSPYFGKQRWVFVALAIPFTLTLPSAAQVIENPDNNRYYELIVGDNVTWEEARADAATRSFNGWTGQLVTITDASEEAFLIDTFPDIGGFRSIWLGGSDEGQEGHWYWITGETWSYENWEPGEPNNSGGHENCLEYSAISTPRWNDLPCNSRVDRWLVEYGETSRGSETGVVSLVFERPTKMKKVEAALFMSSLNQSLQRNKPHDLRRLHCLVNAKGKSGRLKIKGKLFLRLLGRRTTTSTAWQSPPLVVPLNRAGGADFGPQALLELIGEATTNGVELEIFEITFDGGRGKKVTELTIDCLHRPVED